MLHACVRDEPLFTFKNSHESTFFIKIMINFLFKVSENQSLSLFWVKKCFNNLFICSETTFTFQIEKSADTNFVLKDERHTFNDW